MKKTAEPFSVSKLIEWLEKKGSNADAAALKRMIQTHTAAAKRTEKPK